MRTTSQSSRSGVTVESAGSAVSVALGSVDPIDPAVLADLKDLAAESGENVLEDVVEIFLADTTLHLAQLRDALRDADREEVGRLAHSVKGSSATLGASRMEALCRDLERADDLPAGARAILADPGADFFR